MLFSFRLLLAPLLIGALAGCATTPPAPCVGAPPSTDVVYIVDHGWHTDIGVPASELSGPAAAFRAIYPGVASLVFSYGKRTFLTAPVDDWSEYLLGPVPGPGAILVTGLNVMPDEAYVSAPVVVLRLPIGGARALSDFLWRELRKDRAGRPLLIDPAPFPGGVFYAATDTYTLTHTCNTWAADALRAAGLPVDPAGVVVAGQVMARARQAALCPLAGPAFPAAPRPG
jgi:hypothetical protein